jgi:hypothetical protein
MDSSSKSLGAIEESFKTPDIETTTDTVHPEHYRTDSRSPARCSGSSGSRGSVVRFSNCQGVDGSILRNFARLLVLDIHVVKDPRKHSRSGWRFWNT